MKTNYDHLDLILKKSLSGYKVPALKRNLSEAVIEKARKKKRRALGSMWTNLVRLAFYWSCILLFTILVFSGFPDTAMARNLAYIMTPILVFLPAATPKMLRLLTRL